MRRTRKWAFVAQEATRLAGLGLSAKDISVRLDVTKSTVNRWIASGKLPKTGPGASDLGLAAAVTEQEQTPAQWAADVRAAYALDSTDDQLVTMAEATLLLTRDPGVSPPLRLQAMARFQGIVKQLALVARRADSADGKIPAEDHKKAAFRVVRRTGVDPRRALMAVNE